MKPTLESNTDLVLNLTWCKVQWEKTNKQILLIYLFSLYKKGLTNRAILKVELLKARPLRSDGQGGISYVTFSESFYLSDFPHFHQ